jgi:N-glycosylase/DNA lyase
MSGQAFRWRRDGDLWFGVDGPFAYWVDDSEAGVLTIESNGTEEDFRRLFRLEESLAEVAEEVRRAGPELAPYIVRLAGLRVMRQTCAVETAVSFLCTANNHMVRIVPMVERLAGFGAVMLEHRGEVVRRFPSLEAVAGLDESELRANGFGYRGKTIPEAAKQMVERGGEGWLVSLRDRPYEEAFGELVGIKGIGPKLADCIALFGLDHMEAVPVDTHVWQAACREYFPEFAGLGVTGARYRAVGDRFRERFGARAGWAQQMLFYDNFERRRS